MRRQGGGSMKTAMTCIALLLGGCAYNPPAVTPAENTAVGGTGGIKYTIEKISDKKSLLTVTASPGFGETEGSIEHRIVLFANKFAAQQCPDDFEFSNAENSAQATDIGFMRRTKIYVFTCR